MTAAELVKALAQRLGVSQLQARQLLDGYLAAIGRQLRERNTVVLRNFGSFSLREVPEKRAYLPSRREFCVIPAHQKLYFKPAEKLRQAVNEAGPHGENP